MNSRVMVAPQFEDTKSEQYRYIFATGVLGGLNPLGAQIVFYLDRPEPETVNTPHPGAMKLKKIVRELQVEVWMTPAQFKAIAEWMNKNIEEYEKRIGPIPTPPTGKGKKNKAPSSLYA